MARYIDAEPMLRESIEERKFVFATEDALKNELIVRTVYKDLAEFIDNQPTADVVEVKHGEWIWTENGEADYEQFWVCSVCKEKSYIKTKFCSDCGAKIDGGKAE